MTNALFASEDHELDHCSNQVGSRVLEKLVQLAPPSALIRYMEVFSSNLRVVATDRFSGHVLQSLLAAVAKFGLVRMACHFALVLLLYCKEL